MIRLFCFSKGEKGSPGNRGKKGEQGPKGVPGICDTQVLRWTGPDEKKVTFYLQSSLSVVRAIESKPALHLHNTDTH